MTSIPSTVVELNNAMSSQDGVIEALTYQRTLFPVLTEKFKKEMLSASESIMSQATTNVIHESIEGSSARMAAILRRRHPA